MLEQARSYKTTTPNDVTIQIRQGLTIAGNVLFETTQPTEQEAEDACSVFANANGWTWRNIRSFRSSRMILYRPLVPV